MHGGEQSSVIVEAGVYRTARVLMDDDTESVHDLEREGWIMM